MAIKKTFANFTRKNTTRQNKQTLMIIWFRWKSLIEQKNFSLKLRSFDFIYLF